MPSRLSNWCKALLHTAPASLGVDEATRRLVQLNVGGSESAATMGWIGFCRVMAWWEERGWRDSAHPPGYWTAQADATSRQAATIGRRAKVFKLCYLLGWTIPGQERLVDSARLGGMIARVTQDRRTRLDDCDAADLDKLIEALKAILARAEPARAL